jgi:hypothetical protein
MDDRHPVAETLSLFQIVRGEQRGHLTIGPETGEHVEQLVPDAGVKSNCRLVQEQHLRLRHQGPRNLEAAPLTAAESPCRAVQQLCDSQLCRELLNPGLRVAGSHTPEPGMQFEVPATGQSLVDHGLLKDHAAHTPSSQWLNRHVETGKQSGAAGWGNRAGEHADRRRLACPLGPRSPNVSPGRPRSRST